MKRLGMVLLTCSLACCVLMFAVAPRPVAAKQGEANVTFRWAFGACLKSPRKLVAIKRGTTLKSGDEIQMLLELQTKSYVYVIYRSPQGEVYLLFPYDLQQYDTEPVVEPEPYLNRYYIPEGQGGSEWIELDEEVGRETFYLLASARRLTKLEGFIAAYEAAGPAEQAARAKQVVAEVRQVRRSYRKFATLARRPVTIGGNVRSRCPSIGKEFGREISAQNFYGRTFTFNHR